MLRRRSDRGAAAILVALVSSTVLFATAALTVDLGNTWARRGELQLQVDRAAKFAAELLPVDTTTVSATPTTSQLSVAKAAAYYLACNEVTGQDDLSSSIPACPSASSYTTDAGITTYANALLTAGRTGGSTAGAVSFPTVNQVSIQGPKALVSFGFAQVVGKNSSVQTKSATAEVLSPGQVVPIALSLSCVASKLGNAPLGAGDTSSNVMPINYVSTGSGALASNPQVTTSTSTLATYWGDLYQGGAAPATISLASSSINSVSGAVTLTFGWTSSRSGWTVTAQQIFIRQAGYTQGGSSGAYAGPVVLGTTSPAAPYTVLLPPGDYEALIRVTGANSTLTQTDTWTNNPNQNVKFTVPDVGRLSHHVTCARPAQSPRLGISSDADAMSVNIAQGVDHGLQAFPGLANAVDGLNIGVGQGTTVSSASTLLSSAGMSALACGTQSSVKKDYPTRRTDEPNCVHVDTGTDWATAVTRGLLTGGSFATGTITGRLKCPTSGSCNYKSTRATLSSPGGIAGTYNDDHFSDFIKSGSTYTDDPFLMSLDALVSPSVPLVTPPNSALDSAIYSSPRFFWAPYVVTAYATAGSGDYSVLTFRPVFLTSDTSSTITTPVDMLLLGLITSAVSGGLTLSQTLTALGASASCLALGTTACEKSLLAQSNISTSLTNLLGSNKVTVGGMVIDSSTGLVRAARLLTLAPGALPAPPSTYNGPTTDYVGVGPKIIRLTQ